MLRFAQRCYSLQTERCPIGCRSFCTYCFCRSDWRLCHSRCYTCCTFNTRSERWWTSSFDRKAHGNMGLLFLKGEIMNYTICSTCPILNQDNEGGPSCNLGYDAHYVRHQWRDKKEVVRVGVTTMASNCGLIFVHSKDKGIFRPVPFTGVVIENPPKWPRTFYIYYNRRVERRSGILS